MDADELGLTDRLRRYPVDRYPVQHATTQFHLGTALLQAGDVAPALDALTVAASVFSAAGMALEHAKTLVMRGAGLRATGRRPDAEEDFTVAAGTFAELGQPVEEAAAHYNRGLVLAELADAPGASEAFALAEELFIGRGHRVQAGAALRERASLSLGAGEPAAAVPLIERAMELVAASPIESGAAANVLGLALLGTGDAAGAVAAFSDALACHPRSLRAAEHAMVKANLALAHEAAGATGRARLYARQALGTPGAPMAVRDQARELLARLPEPTGDELFVLLSQEPVERWTGLVRAEVLRWADAPADVLAAAAREWVRGQAGYDGDRAALAYTLLDVVLELPPSPYQRVIAALVEAASLPGADTGGRFRSTMRSAMVRFAPPQWQRLGATFTAAAQAAGQPQDWT